MEKKTVKLYQVCYPGEFAEGGIYNTIWTFPPEDSAIWVVKEIDIEIEIPDRESAVLACVDSLQKQKEVISAEAVAKKTAIDAQIQSLLAIEHSEVA